MNKNKPKLPANILLYMGLVAFAFGVVSIITPEDFIETVILSIGVIISISGLILFILKIKNKSKKKFVQIISIIGTILIIATGILLAIYASFFIDILIVVLGICLILGGLIQLILSLKYQPLSTIAKVFLAFSVIIIVAGTVMALNPFKDIEDITTFFGIVMIVFGIISIMMSFWLRTRMTQILKAQEVNNPKVIEI